MSNVIHGNKDLLKEVLLFLNLLKDGLIIFKVLFQVEKEYNGDIVQDIIEY